MKTLARVTSLAILCLLITPAASAADSETLESMLQQFLATSGTREAHLGFWADDLVYTSSAGLRFGKADILASFDADDAAGDSEMVYSGEEIDIRLYDDMAIVAFKLVGTPTDKSGATDVLYYFNTGTFLKRNGAWQAVAWQATRIPPS